MEKASCRRGNRLCTVDKDKSIGSGISRYGPTEGLTLIYNGEIYNFRELRTDLEKAGIVADYFRYRSVLNIQLLGRKGF